MKRLFLIFLFSVCAISARAENEWIPAYRISYVLDAMQTYNIQTKSDGYHESNFLYKRMGSIPASLSVIAVNYGIERAITGIKDKKLRETLGWIAASVEAGFVLHNFAIGVKIRF